MYRHKTALFQSVSFGRTYAAFTAYRQGGKNTAARIGFFCRIPYFFGFVPYMGKQASLSLFPLSEDKAEGRNAAYRLFPQSGGFLCTKHGIYFGFYRGTALLTGFADNALPAFDTRGICGRIRSPYRNNTAYTAFGRLSDD